MSSLTPSEWATSSYSLKDQKLRRGWGVRGKKKKLESLVATFRPSIVGWPKSPKAAFTSFYTMTFAGLTGDHTLEHLPGIGKAEGDD